MKILIMILLVWSAFNSFVAITALLASKMNDDHFQSIKEWLKVLGIIDLDKVSEFVWDCAPNRDEEKEKEE